MEYNFKEIEAKWQRRWQEEETYRVEADPTRPKFYVLDMFPYPSGAGLHVGHQIGYNASAIYSSRNDRTEHRPLPGTARQDRLLVRLAP